MKEVLTHKDNVDLIRMDGREIYLVGTAHVSRQSADLVEETIREIAPDTVAVELCEPRFRSLRDPERWKNTNIVDVIRQGKTYLLLTQLMLSSFQKRVGEKLGVKPGEEMMRALDVAEELGMDTVLADREVRVTLSRTWGQLGFWSGLKVLGTLFGSLFDQEAIDEEEIERLKTADVLEETMKEFSDALPEVRTSLIDERDQYLAAKIADAPGQRVVAVVGAGHVPGIKHWLGEPIDLEKLKEVPPPKKWVKVVAWLIPLAVIAMIIYGFTHAGTATGTQMVWDWVVINAAFGGFGAIMALGHPITIIVAFLVSPFTSLNPTIAAGWVAGLVEAWLRKPRVADFEALADELVTVKGFWKNRVSRILLVVVLTNLWGSLGTFVAANFIASRIAG